MTTLAERRAERDDLLREEGKAELVGGRIIRVMGSGYGPSQAAFEIGVALRAYARSTGGGFAGGDGAVFAVPELSSGRESFSPDAFYHDGAPPSNRIKFIPFAPTFAVEVRSEHDYGPAAELAMSAKRADYFEAGTLVVWDVDVVNQIIRVYRSSFPDQPTTFTSGQAADAEPAAPGWRMNVDAVFDFP